MAITSMNRGHRILPTVISAGPGLAVAAARPLLTFRFSRAISDSILLRNLRLPDAVGVGGLSP